MNSALEIVAFSPFGRARGTVALLDVAQSAMDQDGFNLAAAYVEMAREAFINQLEENLGSPLPTGQVHIGLRQ